MRSDIEAVLRGFLRDAKKIAILAIGNILRGDDAAGVVVGERIKGLVDADVYVCETAPESYVVRILDRGYTHVIIVDSALADLPPGTIFIVDKNSMIEGLLTTHSIPLGIIIGLMEQCGARTLIIGIRPKMIGLLEGLSEEVRRAVDMLSETLIRVIGEKR